MARGKISLSKAEIDARNAAQRARLAKMASEPAPSEGSFTEEFIKRKQPAGLIKAWDEFLTTMYPESARQMEYKGFLAIPPTKEVLEFFKWLGVNRPGRRNTLRQVGTLKREWALLRRIVALRTEAKYKTDEVVKMQKAIELLPLEQVASATGDPKGLADKLVIEDLLHFLWVCDEHTYKHRRERVQIALSIVIMGALGLRPGELVESNLYPDSNDGLKYKDCHLTLLRNGGLRLVLDRRLLKGMRNHPEKAIRHVLWEVPDNRAECPVTLFLALAVADGAFDLAQLSDRTIDDASNSKAYMPKEHMLELPVLRATKRQREISKDKILKYNSLEYQLIKLGQRAGYKEPLTTYCFRRGVGNALDKSVTEAERQLVMSHSNPRLYQLHYASKVVPVDTQSLMNKRAQRVEDMDFMRSMNLGRHMSAPIPTTASLQKYGGRAAPTFKSAKEYEEQRKIKRHRYIEERAKFFEDPQAAAQRTTVSRDNDFERLDNAGITRIRPKPSRYVTVLLKYDLARAEVVRNFYSRENKEPLALEEAVRPLLEMAGRAPWSASYPIPGVGANLNECPWCGKGVEKFGGRLKFNNHLLDCFTKYRTITAKKELRETRFLRVVHDPHSPPAAPPDPSPDHSANPPANRMPACASITPGKTRSSKCLWDSCRYNFVEKSVVDVAKHMSTHIGHTSGSCRWSSCRDPCDSTLNLSRHLLEAHGMPSRATLDNRTFFCYQCAYWATSECAWEHHCDQHLKDLRDPFCSGLVSKSVVLVAPLCPFCLGKAGKSSMRYRQFSTIGFRDHVCKHIRHMRPKRSFRCPHPLCQGDESSHEECSFLKHLKEHHGIDLAERGTYGSTRSPVTASSESEVAAGSTEGEFERSGSGMENEEGMREEEWEEAEGEGEEWEEGEEAMAVVAAPRGGGVKRKFDCASDAPPQKLRRCA